MPDRDVKTIRDLIFYQYAKIMARRAISLTIYNLRLMIIDLIGGA